MTTTSYEVSKNHYESYGGATRIKLNGDKWAFIDTEDVDRSPNARNAVYGFSHARDSFAA